MSISCPGLAPLAGAFSKIILAMLIQKSKIDQIVSLHNELEALLNKSLDNMIRLGELLTEVKAELPHGEFTGWIEENLPFTPRTARRYMKVYNHRAELGGAETITEAYNLLAEPKTDTMSVLPEERKWDEIDWSISAIMDFVWHSYNGNSFLIGEDEWHYIMWLKEVKERGVFSVGEKNLIKNQLVGFKRISEYTAISAWGFWNKLWFEFYCQSPCEDFEEKMIGELKGKVEESKEEMVRIISFMKDDTERFFLDLFHTFERAEKYFYNVVGLDMPTNKRKFVPDVKLP